MKHFPTQETDDIQENGPEPRRPSPEHLILLAKQTVEFTKAKMTVEERPHQFDALIDITWRGRTERFACAVEVASTPRAIKAATQRATHAAGGDLLPMILVPYLTEEKLQNLADQNISALDGSGNALIQSEHFNLWRSGQPNRFRAPSPHLNPFRGDNSIFSRCLLLRSEFESLSHLREFATERLVRPRSSIERDLLRLGTASKTVQALEEHLVIHKSQGRIKLLDPSKLMNQLRLNYKPPISARVTGKTPFDQVSAMERLQDADTLRLAATGLYSAKHYGALSPSETLSVYVDNLATAWSLLEIRPSKAFANCEVYETRKHFPYFDLQPDNGVVWASPIQTWLELANGTAREQEAAKELEHMILRGGWDR